MARRTGEGVRIGPITLLTLVSVLLLAVLAMLCVTTTHATEAMAQRQAIHGVGWACTIRNKATATISLSATGSRKAPKADVNA